MGEICENDAATRAHPEELKLLIEICEMIETRIDESLDRLMAAGATAIPSTTSSMRDVLLELKRVAEWLDDGDNDMNIRRKQL